MWNKRLTVFALVVLSMTLQVQGQTSCIAWTALPQAGTPADTAYRKGISAAFTGLIGDCLIMAGGCNFPDLPASDGGVKRYYSNVYAITPVACDVTWRQIGQLSAPMAYGIALPTDYGLAFIGGTGPGGPASTVYELRLSEDGSVAQWYDLPPLPVTVDNMAGARLGHRLYIVGGNADGVPSRRVFSLSLDSLAVGWREEPSMPGEPRVQPVAIALQYRGETCLYVFGGFAAGTTDRAPSVSLTALRYMPSVRRWEQVAAPVDEQGRAVSLGGAAGYAINDTMALCLGGVDKDIFWDALVREHLLAQARVVGNDSLVTVLQKVGYDYMTHAPVWYRFNHRILRYSAVTDRWKVIDQTSIAARCGAALAGRDSTFYYLGGELKPGIRTPNFWKAQLK